jgi:hypothetical protein
MPEDWTQIHLQARLVILRIRAHPIPVQDIMMFAKEKSALDGRCMSGCRLVFGCLAVWFGQ